MTTSDSTTRKMRPVRQPVLLGLFTGTAVGAGYLLAGVPNVELMTLIIAACGSALGWGGGLLAGILAAVIYSLGSPFGLPVPLLLVAQAAGLGAAGVLGALAGNRVLSGRLKGHRLAAVWWAVLIGAGSTLIYDILTNLAIIGAFQLDPRVVLVGAVPYALLHLASNSAVVGALLPVRTPRLAGLKRSALVGRTGPTALLVGLLVTWPAIGQAQIAATVDSAGTMAPADSTMIAPGDVVIPSESESVGDARGTSPATTTAEFRNGWELSLIHISEPTRLVHSSRIPSSA